MSYFCSIGVRAGVALGKGLCCRQREERVWSRPLPELHKLAYASPRNLALELQRSMLYEPGSPPSTPASHSLWRDMPQKYFESMHYADPTSDDEYSDSLGT